jgi:wyosine [tRNA(Phe)-imidazoG37] synthetase (radical SAM superfamily)
VIDLPNVDPRGAGAKEASDTPPVAFGPVPSRRLGRSLGINNIPPKTCSYSCVYCQLGRTTKPQIERAAFRPPGEIYQEVLHRVRDAEQAGETIDYLTFVPDGEPTLDIHLGAEIDLLRPLGIRVAVISNASLIWHADVRDALVKADWVSLKVDAVSNPLWRRVDRPRSTLHLSAILAGIRRFVEIFDGELVTETMLVKDLNDDTDSLEGLAAFIGQLKPATAYLAIPTRPPAEKWAQPPSQEVIDEAYWAFRQCMDHVEHLVGYEGDTFAPIGRVCEDLLSITAVHPMREEAVREFLARAGAEWSVVDNLIAQGQLVELDHGGHTFYRKKLHGR